MLWSVDFSNDHTFYLPTCHSSAKVVEFSGSNLVIVGAGTTGKGREEQSRRWLRTKHWQQSFIPTKYRFPCYPANAVFSIQIILSLNGLSTYMHPQSTGDRWHNCFSHRGLLSNVFVLRVLSKVMWTKVTHWTGGWVVALQTSVALYFLEKMFYLYEYWATVVWIIWYCVVVMLRYYRISSPNFQNNSHIMPKSIISKPPAKLGMQLIRVFVHKSTPSHWPNTRAKLHIIEMTFTYK